MTEINFFVVILIFCYYSSVVNERNFYIQILVNSTVNERKDQK